MGCWGIMQGNLVWKLCMNDMHFMTDFDYKIWKEYVQEKVLWLEWHLILDYLDAKQRSIVCTMKLQKNKWVSAVSLYETLLMNWRQDSLLDALVVFQVRGTPVATLYLIRFVSCCVGGYEYILISGHITCHRKHCICIDERRVQDMIVICDA